MKYVICSDIHGNLPALTVFLEIFNLKWKKNSKIICLGDIVGYSAEPSGCLSLVRKLADKVIKGNHERMLINSQQRDYVNYFARRAIEISEGLLSEEEKVYITGLPDNLVIDEDILICHGSPEDPDEYIFTPVEAGRAFQFMVENKVKLCFFGHTHIPGVFDCKGKFYYHENKQMKLDKEKKYLINPGSIGQPRDNDKRGSFCVWDDKDHLLNFYRFEYNIKETVEKMEQKNFPRELASRLFYGR